MGPMSHARFSSSGREVDTAFHVCGHRNGCGSADDGDDNGASTSRYRYGKSGSPLECDAMGL